MVKYTKKSNTKKSNTNTKSKSSKKDKKDNTSQYEKLIYYMAENSRIDVSNIFNSLYVYKNPVIHNIIKYNDLESKKAYQNGLELLGKYKNYDIPEITKYYNSRELDDKNLEVYDSLENIKEKNELFKSKTKSISDGFARGIARYINLNYKVEHGTTNGFTKLWELYDMVPEIIPKKKYINIFHLAEAPGQWVNATNHYMVNKDEYVEDYDWRATSLNPKNPENIKKYGKKNLFGDDYGLIANNKKKWIWGADDTGNITDSKNQKWLRSYIGKWMNSLSNPKHRNIDLVMGDGGLGSESSLEDYQKLELAQLITLVSVSTNKSNCIIKHFLPYMTQKRKETLKANGFYTSLIFLYSLLYQDVRLVKPLSSSPNSSEFYVMCIGFQRKNGDIIYNQLLTILDSFKENICLFPEGAIPNSFIQQFIGFIKSVVSLNDESRLIKSTILTCLNKPSDKFKKEVKCDKHLSQTFVSEIQSQRFKKWLQNTDFI
jgi:hypothetical protein